MKAALIPNSNIPSAASSAPRHPPVRRERKLRGASRGHRIDRVEDRGLGRPERAKPQICRRPDLGLCHVQCGQQQSHRGDRANHDREHPRQPKAPGFQVKPDTVQHRDHECHTRRVYRQSQRDKHQPVNPVIQRSCPRNRSVTGASIRSAPRRPRSASIPSAVVARAAPLVASLMSSRRAPGMLLGPNPGAFLRDGSFHQQHNERERDHDDGQHPEHIEVGE